MSSPDTDPSDSSSNSNWEKFERPDHFADFDANHLKTNMSDANDVFIEYEGPIGVSPRYRSERAD